ncbi:GPI ethanolamine phosphate transferase 3 [Cladorrhinum sp. PSN259]|nr:GPI ethanolamine phosphate transferase 3 [Cladorrhinum sp. PSN259]
MPPPQPTSKQASPPPDYKAIKKQWEAAKHAKDAAAAEKKLAAAAASAAAAGGAKEEPKDPNNARDRARAALEEARKKAYQSRWLWTAAFWVWMLAVHVAGIGYFTSGFLLTRLVLEDKSKCDAPPTLNTSSSVDVLPAWSGKGTVDGGCWHPRTFERAVVVLIDALRYDFTVPVKDDEAFHNAFPFMYDTAVKSPNKAFLRPFIADPPTSTLQRLKGLMTGTLPTFVDLGSSFSGTAIDEDNLLMQLRDAGKRIVHLGDDTWESLFPGYFEGNLSRPYDSFNVWDLHTVDNGVIENIFPVLEKKAQWDLLVGHLLGVDHAGHRYGPNHPEMTKKLRQMDGFVRDLAAKIDDKTVLIVMGDHGMDSKGDHGGESDDEVQAALWMYSPKGIFGRTKPEYATPPPTADIRPVNQIDLVPTLALMLGIPIPFNSLGRPIEEVFAGARGNAWNVLAAAERIAAAGIKRYQASYFKARGIEQSSAPGSPADLWNKAEALVPAGKKQDWPAVHSAFAAYQTETLHRCKVLWARFDVKSMITGVVIMAFGLFALIAYISKGADDEDAVDDPELDAAEKSLQLHGIKAEGEAAAAESLEKRLVFAALLGWFPGFFGGMLHAYLAGSGDWYRGAALAALTSLATVTVSLYEARETFYNILPKSLWGWMAVAFTVSQSVGFASNSYTIWEDSMLMFFMTTFGLVSALSALRLPSKAERYMSIYHSVIFVLLGRLASGSKLCREEQMPYCTSTYYASATSSTSAIWQLVIPFLVCVILPSIVKAFMQPTKSYEGLAPNWVGYVFRVGLLMSALYWVLDAADNGNWISNLPEKMLKNISVLDAQMVLGLAFVAGTTAFIWAPPCVSIVTSASPSEPRRAQVAILGYGNAHGARYLLLPLNILTAIILLSKPMGGGAMALMFWQTLSLLEILDLNNLVSEPIGPVMLALLGTFYFFKTGHQAVLSSIQWDSAFIPLHTIRYPWTPIVVALNTFGGQILAAVSVPLIVLWKSAPNRKRILPNVSRVLGMFLAYFAVESLATMMWAGHLRRHLMLYRVFMPRFLTAALVLVVVDLVGIVVSLTGVRINTIAIGEVFGWAE